MGRFRLRKRVVEAPEPDPFFPVPPRFNFTRDVVEAAASADAHRHAMTYVDHEGIIDRRTFKEIAHDASRWTSMFRSRGLEPGDRIVVAVGRTPLWHSVVLGALKGGFVAVPCPETFDTDAMMQRFAHCDARAIVTDGAARTPSPAPEEVMVAEDLKQELRGQPIDAWTHDTMPDDPAFILYTKGTTGAPKGAIHSHASTWAMRLQAEHWLDSRPGDLTWCTADPGSALFVWDSLIGPWSLGSEIVLHGGAFSVTERFDLIDRLGVTVLCQPASEYGQMAEHKELETFYLGSVRHAVSTGAPLAAAVTDAFRIAFGVAIREGYGQTETGLIVASHHSEEGNVGTLGTPIPGYEVAVIDENGRQEQAGVEGEIALRGRPPSLFLGYWNDPDETESRRLGEWHLTGDRATGAADGSLSFVGRDLGQASAHRKAREAAAVAAREQARLEAEERSREAAEERRREEQAAALAAAAAAAAAEQAREETERRRREADEERRREEQRTGSSRSRRAGSPGCRGARDRGRGRAPPRRRTGSSSRSGRAGSPGCRGARDRGRGRTPPRRRTAAAAAAAAEQAREETERQRREADEERLRQEQSATPAVLPAVEPAAPAKRSRREEAAARRAAKAAAKEAEEQRKLDEKRRREEEKAAAEQAKRDEAEAKRAAEAKAREDELQRKLDERRRQDEERAAAEQARRREADAKRAADAAAAEAARREREARKSKPVTPSIPDPDDADAGESERMSAELIARLRAYGHGDNGADTLKDQE